MGNLKFLFLTFLLAAISIQVYPQKTEGIITRAHIIGNDTVPIINLPPVTIFAPMIFESKREERQYSRLVRHIKVVYPYAKLAGIKFREYAQQYEEMESNAERRRLMKQIEKELLDEFEGDLRKLTFTQGKILIKLIDRETQHTSYELLREFRGAFRAVFWQSIGRIFGYDLRTEYDPYGEDMVIEHIVIMIEMGLI